MGTIRRGILAAFLAVAAVVGFSGQAYADEYYWAQYYTDHPDCNGMRAQVGFKQYGEIYYVYDECRDGYAVAIETSYGWTYYHRGGYGTHATINASHAEGYTFRMRACVEFADLVCGSWRTVTA